MQRLEYCEIEGRDPEGSALHNIELIEHLMYLRGDFERGIRYEHDGNVRFISRDFVFRRPDSNVANALELETRVSFLHEYHTKRNKDTYVVKVGWRPLYDGANEDYYETYYTIEQWPTLTYATLDEYDLKTEQLRTHEQPTLVARPMTDYDQEMLFNTLCDVDAFTEAAADSNASI